MTMHFGKFGKMEGFNNIYKNKTVLITGHTGFKGSWLAIWLTELGAKVVGYALDPYTQKDNFVMTGIGKKLIDIRGDIRDLTTLNQVFEKYKPDFVFHLAAQPLVRLSYEKPVETYDINVMGTINVLEAIRNSDSVRVGIMITTDKCYENKEQVWGYREVDQLGGYEPYSSSKACAELAISSWRSSFMNTGDCSKHGKSIASARAGNVIGGGDWAQDRLIPDCIKALESNQKIEIRRPDAVRPWQHVLEPLGGYLLLGEKMFITPHEYNQAWNFGPGLDSLISVRKIVEMVIGVYGEGIIEADIPQVDLHETGFLNLDNSKAIIQLGWRPLFNLEREVQMTVEWYKNYEKMDIYDLCVKQIMTYMKMINR